VKNQHSHDQRQNQGSESARQGQSHTLSPENRHFGRAQIAPVLPNSQNARDGERFRTVSFVLGQLAQRYRVASVLCTSPSQLSEQTPFTFELSNDRQAAKGNEYQAGDS
jgi:hypothetical protein